MNAGLITLQVMMWIGCFLTVGLLLPQAYDIYKTRNTISLNLWMYILYPICSGSWIIYGCLLTYEHLPIQEILGLVISEIFSFILVSYILIIKLYNLRLAKDKHMTEVEWYKQYIKEKEESKKNNKLGIKDKTQLKKLLKDKNNLISIIRVLSKENKEIVSYRIMQNKSYEKSLKSSIKNISKKIDHLKNTATNGEIAEVLSLIYKDLENSN